VTLPEKEVDELLYVYRHASPASLRRMGGESDVFIRRFDCAALQRNVKAIGTFGNQAHRLNRRFYLRFIPPTVAHIAANFERNDRMKPLARRLLPILGELAAKAESEAQP
jgi:aminoglycoside/choline kinase family phosphotransferase